MSECLKKETLLAFVDRELAVGEMESAERHIAMCAACQQQLGAIRATSVNVNALLSSLAPDDAPNGDAVEIIGIPYNTANARMRWAAIASVGVLAAALALFAMIGRIHSVPHTNTVKIVSPASAPVIEKKDVLAAVAAKPSSVVARPRHPKVRKFQALDDGEPMQTGMIYRVSLPASTLADGAAPQSAKRIPAEVIVDEFGKVRAIRFLQ